MTDVIIEPATAADLVSIAALLRDCALPFEDLGPEHLAGFVVARSAEKVVATGGLEPCGDVGLFRSLAVAAGFRGRRLGERIWSGLRGRAMEQGFRRLFLLTTTAEPLFARWGFRRVARDALPAGVRATQEFSALCPSAAVAMTIELG